MVTYCHVRGKRGLDTLFHVVINLYEGVDFFDQNREDTNPEVLNDLT